MNINKISQQLDRRAEAMDRRLAKSSSREPLEDTGRVFYRSKLYYEDAELLVTVIEVKDRLVGQFRGINLDQKGPWVLFKVIDIISGDHNGLISEGAVVLAKWDRSYRVYKKYIYESDPRPGKDTLNAIMAFVNISESELISGKTN